ncbi:MAG: hypothetical protein A49_16350 [Methyloceanibacter sp.]|nr:MAG: hypothetical protein A49_16350 [Methyloceanibacter sp.]
MSGRLLRDHCMLDSRREALLRQAIADLGLSARAHDTVLGIARKIAEIVDHSSSLPQDLMEAIHCRRLDRNL